MRSKAARVGIVVSALAVGLVVFVLVAGADDPPTLERIVVRDGNPVGGVARLEYQSGERVRFSVESDVADEVHVHGFDITRAVPANGSVQVEFPADIEGVFDVELHVGDIKIAELRVNP
jgi:hypothetical protein